ncbi:hypothetical protein CRE_05144 [Caenorhabditis remanei]|uniref:SET domain-containing protein n=1 Tax=Caenorhabditis remanei TaxID=31234 RepID=E3N6B2_CAERE|nr:hypothetical protein CRE_05144 [Caenorhabditis remanei]
MYILAEKIVSYEICIPGIKSRVHFTLPKGSNLCKPIRLGGKTQRDDPSHEDVAKGYRVEAIKDVQDGKNLAEYSGEIISVAEKAERVSIINMADDLEPNCYLMNIDIDWYIDSARRSNITRYINHSLIQTGLVKLEKKEIPYRPAFIKEGGENILHFKMNNLMEICLCESNNCSGKKIITTSFLLSAI